MIKRTEINGHTKKELKRHFAGQYIKNPEILSKGCNVTVFQKGYKDWWEHGEIYIRKDGSKAINCYDGDYELDQVEVYLDTRYVHNH